jgi:hypothetical protein
MSYTEAIKKARERGLTDDQILEAIKKQNPHKEEFFNKEIEKGLTSTEILDGIIKEDKKEQSAEKKPSKETTESSAPEIKLIIPQKPSEESKLWIRIFITLVLLSIAATSITMLYRAFFVPKLKPINPEVIIHEIKIPRATPPLVRIYPERDSIRRFAITTDEEYLAYLRTSVREDKSGEFIRIIIEDQKEGARNSRISNLEDFFNLFEINFPVDFFKKIENDFNLFVYTEEATGKIAFAVAFNKEARDDVEWTIMRPWESTMPEDFKNFFGFWDQRVPSTGDFLTTTHKGDMPLEFSIRYKEAGVGSGIYYSVASDRLLFATSLESIKKIIERYYYLGR